MDNIKKTIIIGVLAVLVIFGVYFYSYKQSAPRETNNFVGAVNYKDATYIIEGQKVALKNGIAETESAPGSSSKIVTRYFGNETTADFDGDGREDIAFLLTQDTGGSGTFYYVVAALNTKNGYVGSKALFIGDRISPQVTEKGSGNGIIVNYADRAPGESFAVKPSIGKSLRLVFDVGEMQFGEIAPE